VVKYIIINQQDVAVCSQFYFTAGSHTDKGNTLNYQIFTLKTQ